MTDLGDYTCEQALARSLIITAVNGGITHWARVHGYTVDCPPEQVRAEGLDIADRTVWTVDIDAITGAVTKLIDKPYQCAAPDSGVDPGLLRTLSETLADARKRHLSRVADLKPSPTAAPDYDRLEFEQMLADVVFQVAVADEVIY
jgi:hypothetical protein